MTVLGKKCFCFPLLYNVCSIISTCRCGVDKVAFCCVIVLSANNMWCCLWIIFVIVCFTECYVMKESLWLCKAVLLHCKQKETHIIKHFIKMIK